MNRFFVNKENIGEDNIYLDNNEDLKHIKKVLRMKIGDEIEISDCDKFEYIGEIQEIEKDYVKVKILDKQKFAKEPSLKITLFQGIPKQGKMELIVQKNVELGINKIVPVFMQRTVVSDNGKMDKKIDRWQKVSAEAVKQCKRGIIPEISGNIDFKNMVETLDKYDLVVFPYENEEKRTIKEYLKNVTKNHKKIENIAVIIGPEGGFSDLEAEELMKKDVEPVSLGNTILRTETAGMATVAMLMYELEMK